MDDCDDHVVCENIRKERDDDGICVVCGENKQDVGCGACCRSCHRDPGASSWKGYPGP